MNTSPFTTTEWLLIATVQSPLRISLAMHCPIMIGHNNSGPIFFPEIVCRCDVVDLKEILHPARCRSDRGCPVRDHPEMLEVGLLPKYQLLPKKRKAVLLLTYTPPETS